MLTTFYIIIIIIISAIFCLGMNGKKTTENFYWKFLTIATCNAISLAFWSPVEAIQFFNSREYFNSKLYFVEKLKLGDPEDKKIPKVLKTWSRMGLNTYMVVFQHFFTVLSSNVLWEILGVIKYYSYITLLKSKWVYL